MVTNIINEEIHEVEDSSVNTCMVAEKSKITMSIASNKLNI